jgi:hypothetical protein
MSYIRISENNRFLTYNNGNPFFWLADTGWELIHRLSLEEIDYYFDVRKKQGFTVIQVVVLPEEDGLRVPNYYGQLPLIELNPLTPNDGYFKFVDRIIEMADDKGLILALLPTWGDKVELLAHGKGPIIFNTSNAFESPSKPSLRPCPCWD